MSLARYLSKLAGLVGSDGKVPMTAVTGVLPKSQLPTGSVLQVVNAVTNSQLSGTLGSTLNPAYNSGTSYFTMSFTPQSATSKILITTSPILIEEHTNVQDDFWLAAFYDTTRIGCVSGTPVYYHFGGNYNLGFYALNAMINSWGTATKTVDFRIGAGGGGGQSMFVNYNYNGMDASARNYGFTIIEVAA